MGLVFRADRLWALAWYNKTKAKMTRNQNQFQQGFTVTELLVVFLIMVLMAGLGVISWSQQTPRRNLTLAQNELITNIRKVQGYAISSRNIEGHGSANFYVMGFESNSNVYSVSAIDADGNLVKSIENGRLPQSITMSELNLVDRSDSSTTNPDCIYVIFSVIYGKVYIGGDSECTDGYLTSLVADPPALARQAGYNLGIVFEHDQTAQQKAVFLDSQTGRVEPYIPPSSKQ